MNRNPIITCAVTGAGDTDLVNRAREVVEAMGGRVQTPDQARETLSLG